MELYHENVEKLINLKQAYSRTELLRRMLNTLQAKKISHEMVKRDDIEDIFFVLEESLELLNFRGLHLCLEILDSPMTPPYLLSSLAANDIQLLE